MTGSLSLDARYDVALKTVVFLLPFVVIVGMVAFKLLDHWRYWHIACREDGPVEWLTALVYLAASPAAVWLAIRFRSAGMPLHATLSALLATALFVVGMEEISWGQRLLNLETPELLSEINRQNEITLHNIGEWTVLLDLAYVLVSLYGLTAFLWVSPVIKRVSWLQGRALAQLISPPPFLATYFLIPFLLYSFYIASPFLTAVLGDGWNYGRLPDDGFLILARDQEPAELFLAGGFFLFTTWLVILKASGEFSNDRLNQPTETALSET